MREVPDLQIIVEDLLDRFPMALVCGRKTACCSAARLPGKAGLPFQLVLPSALDPFST